MGMKVSMDEVTFEPFGSRNHFYLGSANVGSRGTSWTKELGMLVTACPKLGEDAKKIFDLYWHIDGMKKLPEK